MGLPQVITELAEREQSTIGISSFCEPLEQDRKQCLVDGGASRNTLCEGSNVVERTLWVSKP
jgi:hypothetical protein